jgi:ArsR family transcriptional regulator, arsenate/arsenite/antimonite-responsive transcriptional repressor
MCYVIPVSNDSQSPIQECCEGAISVAMAGRSLRRRSAAAFRALGDETRLAIVQALLDRGEICACHFLDCCSISQPTLSYHLKTLKDAGLVQTRKRGLWVYYSIVTSAVTELAGLLSNDRNAASHDGAGCIIEHRDYEEES